MDNATISEILIKRNKKICTTKDISDIVPKGRHLPVISALINRKWIIPMYGFKGVYYVLDPEERIRSHLKLNSFHILIKVLNTVLGNEWYFGRITALSLLGLIHQPVSIYYVVNKRFSRRFTSKIFGEIVLVKSSAELNKSCGILTKRYKGDKYRICTIERNAADYAYFYVHGHANKEQLSNICKNYFPDKKKLIDLVTKCYPKKSAIKMKTSIKEAIK